MCGAAVLCATQFMLFCVEFLCGEGDAHEIEVPPEDDSSRLNAQVAVTVLHCLHTSVALLHCLHCILATRVIESQQELPSWHDSTPLGCRRPRR